MHFYGTGYEGFLNLPIYTFWEMARNIDRINAGKDKRRLLVAGTAFGGGADKLLASLNEAQGDIIIGVSKEEKLDRTGLKRLKASMRG